MEKMTVKKRRAAEIFSLCPWAHIIGAVSAVMIALHIALRGNRELMCRLSMNAIRPLHQALAGFAALFGTLSLAELLIGLSVTAALVYIIYELVNLAIFRERRRIIYRLVMRLAAAGLAVYAGFCLLWGTYYYGDDFITASGLACEEITAEQLETVTVYFADMLNYYSSEVERDEYGFYIGDRAAILDRSPTVFRNVERKYPCLAGRERRAKGVHFSRVMSYLDFTGFFFPFTAEANVNMDFPPALFASTVAHELSHQRGVAKEQEANFVAVLAGLESGDADYCYSACMLAYIHLSNALYSVSPSGWRLVYFGLDDDVIKDIQLNSAYWRQFDTPVQSVSNTVYEGFLYSYDQELGLKSYGACVDLLVNYYYDEAAQRYGTDGGEQQEK